MQRSEVESYLAAVGEYRKMWNEALAEFRQTMDWLMERLLHEAAANYLSVGYVSRLSGYTEKQVRAKMRAVGLNPKDGRNLLSEKASEALASNAELMGKDPRDMDLTSPLAYLPMGSVLKQQLIEARVSRVIEWDETGETMRNELLEFLETGSDPDVVADALLAAGWHR